MSVTIYSDTDERVAHLVGVIRAVHRQAEGIGDKAKARLETHRYYKDASESNIEVSQGDVDSFVSLVDEAAGAIEFGHRHWRSGKIVHGLYIVTGAAGLA